MSSSTVTGRRTEQGRGLLVVIAVVFVAGAVTMLYPSISSWFHQYQQSRQIESYVDEIQQLPRGGVDDMLAAARTYNARLTGGATVGAFQQVPASEGSNDVAGYDRQLAEGGAGLMARIKIPTISLDLPIYHGTSDETLLRGVGHLEGTALPVGGVGNHSVLTAHRGLAESELFTRLDQVEVGDTFVIEVFGEVLTYQVRQTQVVDPEDTESLYPTADADLVTLVTCTPLGVNTQRILVTAERVLPTPIADLDDAGRPPAIPSFPWWAVILGAVLIGAVLFVRYLPLGLRPSPRNRSAHPGDR